MPTRKPPEVLALASYHRRAKAAGVTIDPPETLTTPSGVLIDDRTRPDRLPHNPRRRHEALRRAGLR